MADIPTEVRFDMEAVRSAFMRAGDDLKAVVVRELQATAQQVDGATVAAYPRGPTGNLKAGVRLVMTEDGARVRSTAPHAHLYEYGRKSKRRKPTFIPIAARARSASLSRIQSMLDAPREIA